MRKTIETLVKQTDIYEYGFINTTCIHFHQTIRNICEKNTCRQYATTWACPPAVGTINECQKRCLIYDSTMVFSAKFLLENSLDYKGMLASMKHFKKIAQNLDSKVKSHLTDYLILSNEGCGICEKCTYPQMPCRFPERMHHSIEGYGIMVHEIAKLAGMHYNNGENTVTYFGALLFKNSHPDSY